MTYHGHRIVIFNSKHARGKNQLVKVKDVIWVAEDFDKYTAELKELFEGSE